jgi:hypothetical protein
LDFTSIGPRAKGNLLHKNQKILLYLIKEQERAKQLFSEWLKTAFLSLWAKLKLINEYIFR